MDFNHALKALFEGKRVSLPEFGGYWFVENKQGNPSNGLIVVVTKDGNYSDTPWFSKYADRTDWEIVEGIKTPSEPIHQLMDFGNTIRALEKGYCVRRQGWNGKGMYIVKQIPAKVEGLIIDKIQSLPQSAKEMIFAQKGTPCISYENQMLIIYPDGTASSWIPSSTDVFAKDWIIVK